MFANRIGEEYKAQWFTLNDTSTTQRWHPQHGEMWTRKRNAEEGEDRMATEPNIRSGHKTFARYCRCSHNFVSQKCPQWTNPPKQIYKFSIFPVLTSPRISLVCFLFLRFSFLWLLSSGQARETEGRRSRDGKTHKKHTYRTAHTDAANFRSLPYHCLCFFNSFIYRISAVCQLRQADASNARGHYVRYSQCNLHGADECEPLLWCPQLLCIISRRRWMWDEKRWDVNVADGKSIKFAISFFWEKIHKFYNSNSNSPQKSIRSRFAIYGYFITFLSLSLSFMTVTRILGASTDDWHAFALYEIGKLLPTNAPLSIRICSSVEFEMRMNIVRTIVRSVVDWAGIHWKRLN